MNPSNPFGGGGGPFGPGAPGSPYGQPTSPQQGTPAQPGNPSPWGAPAQPGPYGAPAPGAPYGAPPQGNPYGQPQQPYGQPQQPYGQPQGGAPFGAPQQGAPAPYGAPQQPPQQGGWGAPPGAPAPGGSPFGAPGPGAPAGPPGASPFGAGAPPGSFGGYGGAPATGGSAHSHPHNPVRHSYPLAIREAGFSTAAGLVMKTMPYALARFGFQMLVSILSTLWLIVTLGFSGYAASVLHSQGLAAGSAIVGMVVLGSVWAFVVRYTLYLLKAGHIAVLTELITKGQIGNGTEGMFAYGKRIVSERFGEASVLFGIGELVRSVIHKFNSALDWLSELVPIPGLDSIVGVINVVLNAATTYIDETIFSYNLARGDNNPWRSGKDGLIYYCQNAKEMLKTAVWIVLLDAGLTAVIAVVLLGVIGGPMYLLASSIAGDWTQTQLQNIAQPGANPVAQVEAQAQVAQAMVLFLAAVFTLPLAGFMLHAIRQVFLKPVFLTMVMVKFHVSIQNQPIDASWDSRLSSVSDRFSEFSEKESHWKGPIRA